jgi:hypothetical protein
MADPTGSYDFASDGGAVDNPALGTLHIEVDPKGLLVNSTLLDSDLSGIYDYATRRISFAPAVIHGLDFFTAHYTGFAIVDTANTVISLAGTLTRWDFTKSGGKITGRLAEHGWYATIQLAG